MTTPLVVAHRGNSSVAPENTMPAFASAVAAGADMIEIDVHVSADGVAVVIHDRTVDRTSNGSGAVAALGLDELVRLDAGGWFEPAYGGAAIPRFCEITDLLARTPHLGLLLELKDSWEPDAVKALLASVDEVGVTDRVLAQSASIETLRVLRDQHPELRLGVLSGGFSPALLDVAGEIDAEACVLPWALVTDPDIMATIRRQGLDVLAWTANEPAEWAPLVAAGVDGIITDRPDRLRGWMDAAN